MSPSFDTLGLTGPQKRTHAAPQETARGTSKPRKPENRLDGIVFAHEHEHIGSLLLTKSTSVKDEKERQTRSLATFLITTLLLPILLVAPAERDIRIVNVINPFYAAAVTNFSPTTESLPQKPSILLQAGRRSLQMAILTRHLQRSLDSMSQSSQAPKVDGEVVDVASVAPLLAANGDDLSRFAITGVILYFLLRPLLWLLTRSPTSRRLLRG